jgi:hypothetical protein
MSEIMRQKVLRLPLMLVGLMIMGWVIMTFRPNVQANQQNQPDTYRDASSVQLLETSDLPTTATPAPQRPTLSIHHPSSWTLNDITSIKKEGNVTTLVFRDGSARQVTQTLLQQLPSALQTRVGYAQP